MKKRQRVANSATQDEKNFSGITFKEKIIAIKREDSSKAFIAFSFPQFSSCDEFSVSSAAGERIIAFYELIVAEYKREISAQLTVSGTEGRSVRLRVKLTPLKREKGFIIFERRVIASVGGDRICEACYRDVFFLDSGMLCR